MKSDPIIEAAERDLARLDAERQEIAEFIARYRKYKAAVTIGDAASFVGIPSIPPRSSRVDEVMSVVCDVLLERKDAMPLSELLDALIKRQVVIGGRNPKQNLSQKLSHDKSLKSYGKHGWYFADATPPCVGGAGQLDDSFRGNHEGGPAKRLARPLQSNGATDLHSEASRG